MLTMTKVAQTEMSEINQDAAERMSHPSQAFRVVVM